MDIIHGVNGFTLPRLHPRAGPRGARGVSTPTAPAPVSCSTPAAAREPAASASPAWSEDGRCRGILTIVEAHPRVDLGHLQCTLDRGKDNGACKVFTSVKSQSLRFSCRTYCSTLGWCS